MSESSRKKMLSSLLLCPPILFVGAKNGNNLTRILLNFAYMR